MKKLFLLLSLVAASSVSAMEEAKFEIIETQVIMKESKIIKMKVATYEEFCNKLKQRINQYEVTDWILYLDGSVVQKPIYYLGGFSGSLGSFEQELGWNQQGENQEILSQINMRSNHTVGSAKAQYTLDMNKPIRSWFSYPMLGLYTLIGLASYYAYKAYTGNSSWFSGWKNFVDV